MADPPPTPAPPAAQQRRDARWVLVRDVAVFSIKAGIEAVRDVVLIPVAIAAGLVGLLFQARDPGGVFQLVVQAGRRFDRWLDLFGERGGEQGIDTILGRVERAIVEEHGRGGLTQQARETIDQALDSLHESLGEIPDEAGRSDSRDVKKLRK